MEVRVAVAGAGRRLAGQVRVTFESAQSDPTKLAQTACGTQCPGWAVVSSNFQGVLFRGSFSFFY